MWFRGFRILRDPGPVTGDCKAFALTVAWLMAGRSVLRMVWDMLICRTVIWAVWSGEGHAATWVKGRGWICNIYPAFYPAPAHRRLLPLHPGLFAMPFLLI
jgi:hypothetical protein